ncbi:radical SAM protein [Methanoculleus sp. YWC-01]|uniref:Radical SAM protein n=1 Tax=Methanoculleus nereidis TaxID=2735141 RepID=A0ABU3Z4B0_9EURY|nr:radical SAM protein [Methanoculleus sp. YWC-01]MDV4343655.1 radical SAM protein [Methanoculleus sp. YWC-01]
MFCNSVAMDAGGQNVDTADTAITRGCLHPATGEAMRYFEEGRVYSLQIESTLACPQGCRYCYAPADASRTTGLSTGDITAVLASAAAMDVKAVDWLGGDPLVREDWYNLALHARDLGFVNNIWSSGIPLADPEVAGRAVDATAGGFISVHLDTLDPAIYALLHDGDAGEKIRAILRGIENLIDCGKPADELVNCITFTRPLAGDDLTQTMRYFSEEVGTAICLTQMCTVGRACRHPEWAPTPGEVRDACRARDAICYPDSSHSFGTMDVNKFYCGSMVCVTVDGDVTPCSVIRKGFGNIRDQPLYKIVEDHRGELLFFGMREPGPNASPCTRCDQSAVCWGCRAMAYYETGDLCGPDPKCWRAVSGR